MAKSTKLKKTPEEWWSTSIIDMKPGMIRFRGYAIEDLIGRAGFADMVFLLTRGELPRPEAAKLLEAALVAAVDHGPQAPSIAAARMAITCGVGINNAMASAINMLGDVHGGAGEQAVALYNAIAKRLGASADNKRMVTVAAAEISALKSQGPPWRGGWRVASMCRASAIVSIRSIRAPRVCWHWSMPRRSPARSAGALPPSAARSRRSLRKPPAMRSR